MRYQAGKWPQFIKWVNSLLDLRIVPRTRIILDRLYFYTVPPIKYHFSYGVLPKKKCIYTYMEVHFGDNLIHIQYLRLMALANQSITFNHFSNRAYLDVLRSYVADVPNVNVYDYSSRPIFAINAWKNANQFWEKHPEKLDFVSFYTNFFENFSKKIGLNNRIRTADDLIFQAEAITSARGIAFKNYDWLIVNSVPLSSQSSISVEEMDSICVDISKKHSVITTKKVGDLPCTLDFDMSLSEIALQSMSCKRHLMISTGPSWMVLNNITLEQSQGIYLLIDKERIAIHPKLKQFSTARDFRSSILAYKS